MSAGGAAGEQADERSGARTTLADLAALASTFGIERRFEDEPAHHQRALESLAAEERERDGANR